MYCNVNREHINTLGVHVNLIEYIFCSVWVRSGRGCESNQRARYAKRMLTGCKSEPKRMRMRRRKRKIINLIRLWTVYWLPQRLRTTVCLRVFTRAFETHHKKYFIQIGVKWLIHLFIEWIEGMCGFLNPILCDHMAQMSAGEKTWMVKCIFASVDSHRLNKIQMSFKSNELMECHWMAGREKWYTRKTKANSRFFSCVVEF